LRAIRSCCSERPTASNGSFPSAAKGDWPLPISSHFSSQFLCPISGSFGRPTGPTSNPFFYPQTVLAEGGEVIGVIPKMLVEKEIAHQGLTQLRVVGSMHQRKALMADLADGFVALPGGLGTLEEFFEVWTWGQLGLHAKRRLGPQRSCPLTLLRPGLGEGFVFDHHVAARFNSLLGRCSANSIAIRAFTHASQIGRDSSAVAQSISSMFQ
jgi:hypothetical protein